MAIRTLRTLPDEILHKTSRPIDTVNERITVLLDDMLETMNHENGVGLAAVQIGVLRRAVVIDVGEGPLKMINPVITASEGEEIDAEGCLSVPGYQGNVRRPLKITAEYLDENGEKKIIADAEGLLKKAICHELDHLDGIVYTDIAEDIYELPAEEEAAGEENEENDEEE